MNSDKYPEPVEALLIILGTFAILILLSLLYSLFLSQELSVEQVDKNLRLFFIFGGSLFLILPLLYAKFKDFPIQRLFRFRRVPLEVIILSLAAGLTMSILSDELDRLTSMILPIPDWLVNQMQPLRVENRLDWIVIISGAVIIASIAEEGLFRGFLQVTLEKKGDITRAVLLSAISWTLVHMNIYWSIQIFLMGILLGYLAWRTDSIVPAVIMHGLNNLLALLFLNYDWEDTLNWYTWNDHVHPLILFIAGGVLFWSVKQINHYYRASG